MSDSTGTGGRFLQTRKVRRASGEPVPFFPLGGIPLIALGLLFLFALWPFAFGVVQSTAGRTAAEALIEADAAWARANVSGQWITLEGRPPSRDAAEAAVAAVRRARAPTLFGSARPVTRVRDAFDYTNLGEGNPATAIDWSFRVANGVLTEDQELRIGSRNGTPTSVTVVSTELVEPATVPAGFTFNAISGTLTFPALYTNDSDAPVDFTVRIVMFVTDTGASSPLISPNIANNATLVNTASFTSDSWSSVDDATVQFREPNPTITKVANPDANVAITDNIQYTVTVANPNRVALYDVEIVDVVPVGLIVDGASVSDGGVADADAQDLVQQLVGELPGHGVERLLGGLALFGAKSYGHLLVGRPVEEDPGPIDEQVGGAVDGGEGVELLAHRERHAAVFELVGKVDGAHQRFSAR